ncbi:DUF7129 domain-containing putative zinc-binding protein [Haloarcula rubra]
MSGRDPLAKEQRQFQCENCSFRTTAPSRGLSCPKCGGRMTDRAIPR